MNSRFNKMVVTRLKINTNGRLADRPNGAVWIGVAIGASCFVLLIVFLALFEYTLFSTKQAAELGPPR